MKIKYYNDNEALIGFLYYYSHQHHSSNDFLGNSLGNAVIKKHKHKILSKFPDASNKYCRKIRTIKGVIHDLENDKIFEGYFNPTTNQKCGPGLTYHKSR